MTSVQYGYSGSAVQSLGTAAEMRSALDKVEGFLPGAKDDEWLAITDPDDALRPAELLTLRRVVDK